MTQVVIEHAFGMFSALAACHKSRGLIFEPW